MPKFRRFPNNTGHVLSDIVDNVQIADQKLQNFYKIPANLGKGFCMGNCDTNRAQAVRCIPAGLALMVTVFV